MRVLVGLATTLVVALAGLYAFSPRIPPPLRPATLPVAGMLLTDITRTEAGLVAAGEQGHLLLSTDQGVSWQRADLDVQRHALITRLIFTEDESLGLAIGHEGWILRSTDGGRHWREVAFDPEGSEPLLDLARLPSGDWLAVGAFGQVRRSRDDGLSWQAEPAPDGTDWHLNAIAGSQGGGHWMIVGEAGTVLRSRDGGRHWEALPEFYDGSLYGISHLGGGAWVAYGMRGNLFVTRDHGQRWRPVALDAPLSLHAHQRLADGTLVIGGQGGVLIATSDRGATFQVLRQAGNATLTGLQLTPSGDGWFTTDVGLRRLALDAPDETGAS
ncbi:WD40/YVTN/BNR-like repeat-containing protein [Halomonas sp. H5]|uniref:WD40/YVTN/BNR-like repeat-containing protein n=1 Tax=Halomonas sp. H5 TaxID=3423910 RepID=UPI003D36A793